MNINTHTLCLSLLATVGAACSAFGSNADLVDQLDVNGNHAIDNPDEVYLGLEYKLHPDKIDVATIRKTGKIPDSVLNATDVGSEYRKFVKKYGVKASYRVTDINPADFGITKTVYPGVDLEALKKKEYVWKQGLRIRRSADQLDSPKADRNGDASFEDQYAESALFSYGRNFNTKIDQWTARGIIAYSLYRLENPWFEQFAPDGRTQIARDLHSLRTLGFDLSVAFDKVNTGGSDADEVDTLDFGASITTDWRLPENALRFDGLRAVLSGHYATDFNFDKEVVGGTFDLTPTFSWLGYQKFDALFGTYNGPYHEVRSWIDFRWSISAHAEAGNVLEAASEPGLQHYDTFARLGGKADIQLQPFPEALNHRLNLYASYLQYEAVTENTGTSHLFHTSLQYLLPVAGGLKNPQNAPGPRTADDILISLKAEYQNGEIPFVQEKDNSIVVGLGILY